MSGTKPPSPSASTLRAQLSVIGGRALPTVLRPPAACFHAAAHILILPLLTACGTTLPEKVLVPTPVACIKPADMPVRPPLVKDTELRAATRGERTFAFKRYQDLADPYMAEMETALRRCATPP